jgi:hypothetical protein
LLVKAISHVFLNKERSELAELISTNVNWINLKEKFNLEQVMKAQIGRRGIVTVFFFFTLAPDGGG